MTEEQERTKTTIQVVYRLLRGEDEYQIAKAIPVSLSVVRRIQDQLATVQRAKATNGYGCTDFRVTDPVCEQCLDMAPDKPCPKLSRAGMPPEGEVDGGA